MLAGLAAATLGAAVAPALGAAEPRERAPELDPAPPLPPAQYNPDPGQVGPSTFRPRVKDSPAKLPEFAEDLPPARLRLPRRRVGETPEYMWEKLENPEYRLTEGERDFRGRLRLAPYPPERVPPWLRSRMGDDRQPTGLLPGFVPMTNRWELAPITARDKKTGRGPTFPRYVREDGQIDRPLEQTYGSYPILSLWDPFKPSKLKGDFPIYGEEIFLSLTAIDQFEIEARRGQVPSGASAARPGNYEFFGRGDSYTISNNLSFTIELFKGETAFKPVEWALRLTPVINVNYTEAKETTVLRPDPRGQDGSSNFVQGPVAPGTIRNPSDIQNIFGQNFILNLGDNAGTKYTRRFRNFVALQEAFIEYHLKDLSYAYDFVSSKVGIQPFNSDFRGFIFNDTNLGGRLFGNYKSNKYQYNLAVFGMLEKDTFSNLNKFSYRDQEVIIANFYWQDFYFPGYTAQWSLHFNNDHGGRHFDRNGFITRPTPIGTVTDHNVRVGYLGWTGDGHIGWLNLTHAFYWALGEDQFNGLAGRRVNVSAQMFALELSYDRDWLRPKFSFLFASGDSSVKSKWATGFDAIIDQPTFIGNPFSYYARQGMGAGNSATLLKTPNSLLLSLRPSKFEGQSSFVNPGTLIAGLGLDADITPRLKAVFNANWIQMVNPDTLKELLFINKVDRDLGYDLSMGFFYRPTLTQNIIISAGFGAFFPGAGYRDINRQLTRTVPGFTSLPAGKVDRFLYSGLFAVTLTY